MLEGLSFPNQRLLIGIATGLATRTLFAVLRCSRMAQTCLGLNGGFAPMMRPVFQGSGTERKRYR